MILHNFLTVFNVCESFQGLDKDRKGGEGKKGKKESSADEEPDPDGMDWWTKYHASMDTMVRVCLNLIVLHNPDLCIICRLILWLSCFHKKKKTFVK